MTRTVFSAYINSRGTTNRRTFRLDSSTEGGTASIGTNGDAGHPQPNSPEAHSGLTEYR